MTAIPFTKMHGAGNDFVVLDAREADGKALTADRIAALCDRRRGVGADGLLVVAGSEDADFRMTYWNADGGEAEMCGNGARCAVEFAALRGLHDGPCRFLTAVGEVRALRYGPGDVEVVLPGWSDLRRDVEPTDSPWTEHHFCNTGVPHLVIPVPDVAVVPVQEWGRRLRRDPVFAPAGVNVDWVAPAADEGEFLLRTYERGVEDETLACGTGASAAAVVLSLLERVSGPVRIRTRGGDLLVVTVDLAVGTLALRGPVETSFTGETKI